MTEATQGARGDVASTFRAAVVQLCSSDDLDASIASAEAEIRAAAGAGAQLVTTPENTPFLGSQTEKARRAEPLEGPICARFASIARELGIHLLLGSFPERRRDDERCHNTSVLFAPDGAIVAAYRKVHLFDVDLPGEPAYRESATVAPGAETVVAETPLARIGLSICYDLRFPELYRRLVAAGAEVLAVPSAFTVPTGRAHWRTLIRALAIQSQCYVLAPAQSGRHDRAGRRTSYGHSLIVDPWGEVLAHLEEDAGHALAVIDPSRVAEVRRRLPIGNG